MLWKERQVVKDHVVLREADIVRQARAGRSMAVSWSSLPLASATP
jgi:hypothetical protein